MKSCSVCGEYNLIEIDNLKSQQVYRRCNNCEFVQIDEGFFLDSESERERYELHENSREDAGYVRWLGDFLDFTFKGETRTDQKILDFGSGPEPVMAEILKARGFDVYLEDIYFAPGRREGKFDIITSVEVFEHLKNPLDALLDLAGRLGPGGSICISTEFLPSDLRQFPNWHYRSDATHISFFSSKTLMMMARKAGLELTEHDGKRYARFRSLSQNN